MACLLDFAALSEKTPPYDKNFLQIFAKNTCNLESHMVHYHRNQFFYSIDLLNPSHMGYYLKFTFFFILC